MIQWCDNIGIAMVNHQRKCRMFGHSLLLKLILMMMFILQNPVRCQIHPTTGGEPWHNPALLCSPASKTLTSISVQTSILVLEKPG